MAFKSKDLSYSQSEPAFLRRIRGEIRGSVDDPDRQINPVARPKASKRLENEEDDAPAYVLEETNQDLSKEEYEALLKGEAAAPESAPKDKSEIQNDPDGTDLKDRATDNVGGARPKEKVAEIGGLPKKRKAAKIIGQDDEDDYAGGVSKPQSGNNTKSAKTDEKKSLKKKKTKAIKLSFGDEEEP